MSGWGLGGVLGALLGLVVLEAVVSNPGGGANGGVPGLLALPGKLAASWMDPTKPLIGPGSSSGITTGFGAAGLGVGLSATINKAQTPPTPPARRTGP